MLRVSVRRRVCAKRDLVIFYRVLQIIPKMWFFEEVELGGYDLIFRSVLLVDKNSSNFFSQTPKKFCSYNTCPI